MGTLLLPVAMKFATTRFGQKPTVAFEAKLSVFFCFYIFLSICLFWYSICLCIYIYKPSSTFLPLLERGHSHSVMLPLYIRFPRPGVLSRWLKSRRKKNEWEKWVRSWISCALGTVCDQWPCWKNIWKSLGQSLGYSILTMESMDVWKTNMFNQDINHCISWESSCLIVTHMVSNA